MFRRVLLSFCALVLSALPASAATISGLVTDATGAALPGTRIVLRTLASGGEVSVETGADGRYRVEAPAEGSYLILVARAGFAAIARTVVVERMDQQINLPLQLVLGPRTAEVSVTATRAERETRQIPLHVETLSGVAMTETNPLSTGDVLANVVNIMPVGNGPFGVRPRLRGLDSTRLLVLVDGERMNTARQATDRTGAEVGLIAPDALERAEIVNGAGTLMYGSDALAGTINIITNDVVRSDTRRFSYGFRGFHTSNENGNRGSLNFGVSSRGYAVHVEGGAEKFETYRTGAFDTEDTRPMFASGQLHQVDTIDDFFGFSFKAFPEPFNAPYVRTDREVPNSQAHGNYVNAAGFVGLGERRGLRMRYQRRRMENVGFPDFAQPYFFNPTSLPHSDFDRGSVRYEAQMPTSWLANLSITGYVQRTERLLLNQLPVQFPVPAATFLPISVFRLDIRSETQQQVWTPGVDAQLSFAPRASHLVTAGLMTYVDRSHDERTTTTAMSMVGQVVLGQRGPAPVVFPEPIALGPATIAHPVRVPDARFRDVGVFVQDEWRVKPQVSVTAGVRGDFYTVTTEATPGYDVSSVIAGATPPLDPATLPDPNGASYSRQALTGDVGLMANVSGRVNPFVRLGRSYRHPNLEEMLFAGPATIGSIAPNVLVKPEVGTNFDAGAKFRIHRVTGGAYAFINHYSDFIAQDLVVATIPSGPLAQATNFADVTMKGGEVTAEAPIVFGKGVLTLSGAGAFMRGTIVHGENPLDGSGLDGTPADNITPVKFVGAVRFTAPAGRWWVEYGLRAQTDVTRVAQTLLESPFLIAQDLLSLDGFTIQRLAGAVTLFRKTHQASLTVAVENLTNEYYREQFQFAPSRGRSVTFGFEIRR